MELGGGGGNGDRASKRARLASDDSIAAAAGEDRLSALPTDVLVLILLKLSIRDAAWTSILSRSWRRIWALLPVLHFRESLDPRLLRDVLDAHEVPVRDLAVVAGGASATAESLAVWLPAAARRVSGKLSFSHHPRVEDAELQDDEVEDAEWEDAEEAAAQSGAFELPCFEKATSISLLLGFHGLAMPPTGVFTLLTKLHLRRVRFHNPGELGDAVSSPRCPCLQTLTIGYAHGLGDLTIHSESLLHMELKNVRGLSQLTVVAPALNELNVESCFYYNQAVVNISAPHLATLDWFDKYDPSYVDLGKMAHLRRLQTEFYLVYGKGHDHHNHSCLSLLRRIEAPLETLTLMLMYQPLCLLPMDAQDIWNYQYMMKDMTLLPDITILCLTVIAFGHALEASVLHVLRLCTGIRRLFLRLAADSENFNACSSDCICDQPVHSETEDLLLNHLEEVEIIGWRGTEHEVAFVKRLFNCGTKLKEMTVTFYYPTSEVTAKEAKDLYQMFQSLSRAGVCMKFYLYRNSRKVSYALEE